MNIKKISLIILLIVILVVAGVIIVYASSTSSEEESVLQSETIEEEDTTQTIDLEIGSDYFVTNINDIYLNYEDYEGKVVSYKGMIYNIPEYNDFAVVRYYYCCGYDYTLVGLECYYDGEALEDYEWVNVVGTVEVTTDETGDTYPYLNVISLEKTTGTDAEKYVNN